MLRSAQPVPIEAMLTTLINAFTAIPRDFALVLDDYHVIDAQPVADALLYLLDNLPPQVHLRWQIIQQVEESISYRLSVNHMVVIEYQREVAWNGCERIDQSRQHSLDGYWLC